jgi:hypothetical protein
MRSSKLLLIALISGVGALVVSALASADTINLTTHQTLFSDNFESQPEGQTSHIAAPDGRGGLDAANPTGGSPGSWSVFDQNNYTGVQVTDHAGGGDPGAAQGTKYLRLYRPDGGGDSAAQERFSAEAATNGDHIRWEQGLNIDAASAPYAQLLFRAANDDVRVNLMMDAAGNVLSYSGGSFNPLSGVSFTPGAWQRWTVDYNVGASTFDIAVGGTSATGCAATSAGSVGYVGFVCNGASTFYLDAPPLPEPSSIVLVVSAMLGLLAYAWRKRK